MICEEILLEFDHKRCYNVENSLFPVYYAWQWEDEKARWNPYGIQESIDLEAAHQAGEDTIDLDISGRAYSVDLKSLEQTNTATKVTRKIARIKSGKESSWWFRLPVDLTIFIVQKAITIITTSIKKQSNCWKSNCFQTTCLLSD